MLDSTQPGGNGLHGKFERKIIEASVYGLRQKHLAKQLIERLNYYGCIPTLIFRVDKFGRQLVAVDANTSCRYYITVKRWGPPPVVINFTTIAKLEGRSAEQQANRALRDFMLPGSPHPMLVPYEVMVLKATAKKPPGAS